MDIFTTVSFTFLFYTNGAIAVCTMWWEFLGTTGKDANTKSGGKGIHELRRCALVAEEQGTAAAKALDDAFYELKYLICDMQVDPEEFRRHCAAGVQKAYHRWHEERNLMRESKALVAELEHDLSVQLKAGAGAVLLPPCCVPFCCFAGRQRVISEVQVNTLLDSLDVKGELKDSVRERLLLGKRFNDAMDGDARQNLSRPLLNRPMEP